MLSGSWRHRHLGGCDHRSAGFWSERSEAARCLRSGEVDLLAFGRLEELLVEGRHGRARSAALPTTRSRDTDPSDRSGLWLCEVWLDPAPVGTDEVANCVAHED